jgi:hypothetical protein
MYPHRIRLRGPWTLKTETGHVLSLNVRDGSNTELDPTPSAIQLSRRFSWLQPLQAQERLWLVLEHSAVAKATLNDSALELAAIADGHQECEVTSLTQRSNLLALHVAPHQAPEAFPQVALEVRCRTFLRQPAWRLDESRRRFEITGLLVGVNDTPLELYARLGELNVLYALVHANEPSLPFRYESEIAAAAVDQEARVQIDLVSAGVLWHRVSGKLASGPEER